MKEAFEKLDDSARMHETARSLLRSYDYRAAVEQSQHSMELAIKAVYLAIEGRHPLEHDAHEKELQRLIRKLEFKTGYAETLRGDFARAGWITTMWRSSHNVSIYGFAGPQASAIFREKDAKMALDYSWEVYLTCRSVLDAIKRGEIVAREGGGEH
jgi:HEPN domain-containing protein